MLAEGVDGINLSSAMAGRSVGARIGPYAQTSRGPRRRPAQEEPFHLGSVMVVSKQAVSPHERGEGGGLRQQARSLPRGSQYRRWCDLPAQAGCANNGVERPRSKAGSQGMDMVESASTAALRARRERAAWVAERILPYEPRIRAWLSRWPISPEDADELLQDAYCRIALLPSLDHIDRPRAYFFSIVRNLLARRHRRQPIVSFELIAEIDAFHDHASEDFEDKASDRLLYEKIIGLIDRLPPKCRRIVRLRKIEDWSQKDIAAHLQISEKTVECQIRLGLKAIREAWDREEAQARSKSSGRLQAGAKVR